MLGKRKNPCKELNFPVVTFENEEIRKTIQDNLGIEQNIERQLGELLANCGVSLSNKIHFTRATNYNQTIIADVLGGDVNQIFFSTEERFFFQNNKIAIGRDNEETKTIDAFEYLMTEGIYESRLVEQMLEDKINAKRYTRGYSPSELHINAESIDRKNSVKLYIEAPKKETTYGVYVYNNKSFRTLKEEKLKQYLLNLTFPVSFDEVYKEIISLLAIELPSCPHVKIEICECYPTHYCGHKIRLEFGEISEITVQKNNSFSSIKDMCKEVNIGLPHNTDANEELTNDINVATAELNSTVKKLQMINNCKN